MLVNPNDPAVGAGIPGLDGLETQFAAALARMIAASGGKITIKSGYRSVAEQTQLWNAKLKETGGNVAAARHMVAPPGKSNHNRGLAADLAGDLSLAHRLAPQFGLTFPMSWERWHIEPVWARDKSHEDAYSTAPRGEKNPTRREPTEREIMASLTDDLRRVMQGELPDEEGAQFMPGENTGDGAPIGGDADKFLAAIRKHESGGNYKAKNPHGSASGAYQFIDSTWRGYAGKLGISAGRAMDASPEDQDRVARAYLQSLMGISQDPKIWAVGWYGGPGAAQQVAKSGNFGIHPGGANPSGLTYGVYADRISKSMQEAA